MKKLLSLSAMSFLVAAFIFAGPVWAGGVEDKIKVLEDELAKLKTQQLELKKEATAAADALPAFSYRPGRGMTITAADKSWAFNVSWILHTFMYNHPDGEPVITEGGQRRSTGMHDGQFFMRRNRPNFTFCWADCFYEYQVAFTAEDDPITPRDNALNIHFEKWNPYLPMFTIGPRVGGEIYHGRSSASGFKTEHNLLISGNSTTATGSSSGVNLTWEEIPVGPGDFTLFLGYRDRAVGHTNADVRDSDRKAANLSLNLRPFSQTKSKWIQGFEFMVGTYLQPIDGRACSAGDTAAPFGPASGACGAANEEPNRLRIRAHERNGRVTLFDTGSNIGSGLHHYTIPSTRWRIGPYSIRANVGFDRWEGENDSFRGVRGRNFEIENGLWVWSPKGLLTGSTSTPNSVQLGWTFERVDVECGVGCDAMPQGVSGLNVHRNRILYRELFAAYWIRPALRAILWWGWYDTANTPERTQLATGCKKNEAAAVSGKADSRSCDWHTINAGLQFRF